MKYIMSVVLSLFLFIGINMTTPAYSIGILSQDGPETTWDPQFESIDFYRKPNSNDNYENIINFVFGDYWKPHPFRVDLNTGTIALKIKVKGPNSPDLAWDENWIGEIWTGDITKEDSLELVGTFNKNTEYFIIPVDKIYNQTRIAIRIKGIKEDGSEVIYDTFYSGLSAVELETSESTAPPSTSEYPCYVSFLSESSVLFPKEENTFQFNVNVSKTECPWEISTNKPEWIEILGDNSRTGNSQVQFKVKENTTEDVRFGTIVLDKQTFTVVQLGKQPQPTQIIVEVPVQIPAPSQLNHILVNVDSEQRLYDSTLLKIVDLESKDPLVYLEQDTNTSEGNLIGWGRNFNFELGNGKRTRELIPINLDTNKNWNKISANVGFGVGIDNTLRLYVWGQNSFGQLGTGDKAPRNEPSLVNENMQWKDVSAGKSHILAISTNGELYSSGRNTAGQLGLGNYITSDVLQKVGDKTDWVMVNARGDQSFAIDSQGNLYAWGFNNYGQLGVNKNDININTPTIVSGNRKWKKVSAGEFHTLGLTDSNELFGWGRNTTGQLGIGFNSSSKNLEPIRVGNQTWIDIESGYMSSGAINNNNELYTWGLNNFGQLGIGNTASKNEPTKVNLNFVDKISFGTYHGFAITQNGEVYCWGRNNESQLGLGSVTPAAYNSPVRNDRLDDIVNIFCGDYSTFATILVEDTVPDNGQEIVMENQTVVFVPVNSSISFSWLGQTLENCSVKVEVKLENGTMLVEETYTAQTEQSKEIIVGSQQYRELVIKLILLKDNMEIDSIETKFLVKGFKL